MAWDPDYIDFISEYCDRWCERCPLTHRCAAYTRENDPREIEDCARDVERAMEALRVELAMPAPTSPAWLDDMAHAEANDASGGGGGTREFEGRRLGVRNDPMLDAAHDYAVDVYTWLRLYAQPTRMRVQQALERGGGSLEATVLRFELDTVDDALEIVKWDCTLIPAKLHRALGGRFDEAAAMYEDPVQTDFNGSAKLALLLTERSEAGWRLIAQWSPEPGIATQLADALAGLRTDIERAFPHARRFIRPGFDELPS